MQKPDEEYMIDSIRKTQEETGITTMNIVGAIIVVQKISGSDGEAVCENVVKICSQGPDKIEEVVNHAKADNEQGGLTGMINGLTNSLTG